MNGINLKSVDVTKMSLSQLINTHDSLCKEFKDVDNGTIPVDNVNGVYENTKNIIEDYREEIIERLTNSIGDLRDAIKAYPKMSMNVYNHSNIDYEYDDDFEQMSQVIELKEIESVIVDFIEQVYGDISWYDNILDEKEYKYLETWLNTYEEEH